MLDSFFEFFLKPEVLAAFLILSFFAVMWIVYAVEMHKNKKHGKDM